jgi:hypothetical protein
MMIERTIWDSDIIQSKANDYEKWLKQNYIPDQMDNDVRAKQIPVSLDTDQGKLLN